MPRQGMPFVDRRDELAGLRALLDRTVANRGGVVTLQGIAGIGKSSLVAELAGTTRQVGQAGCQVVQVRCLSGIGSVNAFGPVMELLLAFPQRKPRRGLFSRTARGLVSASPDLLSLVPTVGPLLQAGAKVTMAAVEEGWPAEEMPLAVRMRQAMCDEVLTLPERHGPIVVAVDDAHRIDESSCHVLRRLLPLLQDRSLSFVIAYRPDDVTEAHPLADLLREAAGIDDFQEFTLAGLPRSALADYLAVRQSEHGAGPDVESLMRVTGGHPIHVDQCLKLLDEQGISIFPPGLHNGPAEFSLVPLWLENGGLPRTVESVLRERIKGIGDETRRLLAIAAVQGEQFLTRVVEEVSGWAHERVLELLYQACQDFGVIRQVLPPPWADRTESDFYEFDHMLIQQSFYHLQSPQTKRDRHARTAQSLERIKRDVSISLQELNLSIGLHYHQGKQLMRAAEYALRNAREMAQTSSSFTEAADLCQQALHDLRALSSSVDEANRLHVEVIELLLVVTALRWRGRLDLQQRQGLMLAELAAEAIEVAGRTGDATLRARALVLAGKTSLRTSGVNEALPKLREAVELARTTEDVETRFIATVEYGHQLAKQDLRAGLDLLREAEALYESAPSLAASQDPIVQHNLDEARTQLGINSFDIGDFAEAVRRIDTAVESLRARGRRAELAGALNYRAQILITLGDRSAAVEALREAVRIEGAQTDERTGWYAWNLALLGRTLAQDGGLAEAQRLADVAWQDAQRLWLANIVPVVQVYCAEVQLACGTNPARDDARRFLDNALDNARRGGLPRSEVNALSLLARLSLEQDDITAAVELSTRATELMQECGALSTVRIEEILLRHAWILHAAQDLEGAQRFLELAVRERDRKAASLPEGPRRQHFLTAERLNRRLATAEVRGLTALDSEPI